MKDNIKVTIYFSIFIVVMVIAWIGYNKLSKTHNIDVSSNNRVEENEQVKKTKLPEFEIYTENGEKISSKEFIGKPIVFNLWTSWCGYCDVEMPYFNELYLKEKEAVTFVMINVTPDRDSKEAAKSYVENNGYSFSIYYDLKMDALNALGVYSYPATIFVDKDGYIDSRVVGMISKETLESKINSLK